MNGVITRYRTIKLYGLDINEVKKEISDLLSLEVPRVEIVTKDAETHIILSADGESEDEAKGHIKLVARDIKKRLGDYIYSTKTKETLEMAVVRLLEKHELTISTAESCTGGLLAARLINVAGVSEVYKEGFITYTNKAKRKTLDVSKTTLKKYGAVSKQTAKEMATGAVFAADCDVSVAITGIAGPDGGSEQKPVGLVYIACCINGNVVVEQYNFGGDRMQVREQSVNAALNLLRRCIIDNYR